MNTNDVLNKLIAEIERLKGLLIHGACAAQIEMETNCKDEAYNEVLSCIDSLRQEQPESGSSEKPNNHQPEVDLDFQVFAKEMDAVFNLPKEVTENTEENPLNWEYTIARHFYELGLKARKEELPEIELDKFTDKVDIFKARYKHPEIVSIKGAMAFMARMFYQYPNVARQWYDGLPKATMD